MIERRPGKRNSMKAPLGRRRANSKREAILMAWSFHDVLETKGVNIFHKYLGEIYIIESKIVSQFLGLENAAACHYLSESQSEDRKSPDRSITR